MTVIAVGHTPEKFGNLLSLIPEGFDVVQVFNGLVPAGGIVGAGAGSLIHQVKNDLIGRDVAMYHYGVKLCHRPRYVFLNDDVVHLSDYFWDTARRFLANGDDYQLVGVPNLSSWIDYDMIEDPATFAFHLERGRDIKFVRTSAFMATRAQFNNTPYDGSAQKFEKNTLHNGPDTLFLHPKHAYDSNIEPYIPV